MDPHPHTDISIRNQKVSSLLRLPAELRNEIYGYALGGNEIHFTYDGWYHEFRTYYYNIDHESFEGAAKYCPDLIEVCRQIHEEARTLPFERNNFDIDRNQTMSVVLGPGDFSGIIG
ncbi:hypothetical protein EK21DRAFT_106629 [Setomelanomma holmii]|uniref:DUF7730 domain-containing protein n=1 Tax=Setomelanomma holmii TaxID=210430 RepID=A0A9P4HIJ5_9PLEO|nr:hypothetical protein EK21DRAFT_106629 [Setomelanomma holmii]